MLNASVKFIPFAVRLFLISEFTYKVSVIWEHEEAYTLRKVWQNYLYTRFYVKVPTESTLLSLLCPYLINITVNFEVQNSHARYCMSVQFWIINIHKAKLHSFISISSVLLFLSNYILLILKVLCLEDVTMPEIKKWYNDHVLCGNKSNLRKLSVQVSNHGHTWAYFICTQFCKPLHDTVAPDGLSICVCSFIFNLCIWCSQAW